VATSLKNETKVSRIVFASLRDSFCISEATSLKNETEVFEHGFLISSSLKNETRGYEDSFFFSVATSLKNETEVTSIVLVSMSSSLKNEIVFPLSV
jgi:hypothetical protein